MKREMGQREAQQALQHFWVLRGIAVGPEWLRVWKRKASTEQIPDECGPDVLSDLFLLMENGWANNPQKAFL